MRNIMLVANKTGDELCIEKACRTKQNEKKQKKNTHEDTTHACE